ncbi:MAG: hypothetical protein SF028_05395 [Candidatus Sumerlaeia bacterium]|nr:hypothetical protein [Candidatus Sumerlaeia bacterium]
MSSAAEVADKPAWGTAQLVGFRFAFLFFIGTLLPIPLTSGEDADPISRAAELVVAAFGRAAFGVEAVLQETGSGDSLFQWVRTALVLALSLLGTLGWSLLQRRAANHERLHEGLRIFLRLYLMASMAAYGWLKIFPGQFPAPTDYQLERTYGQYSPMGILWTLMGLSRTYQIFGGLGELMGGALLAFRRTTTLGALVIAGVMANVVALNFSYDVPVKLYSSMLLLAAVFLALPDAPRLLSVLVLGGGAPPPAPEVRLAASKPRLAITGRVLFYFFSALAVVGGGVAANFGLASQEPEPGPLDGHWKVASFVRGGVELPPSLDHPDRWHTFAAEPGGTVFVRRLDLAVQRYGTDIDAEQRTIELRGRDVEPGTRWSYVLDGERLSLEVFDRGSTATVQLERAPAPEYPLRTRGFHWVQEFPYNR